MKKSLVINMRIFVTGGKGFIGSHLVRALLDQEHEVTTLSRYHYNSPHPKLKVIQGDLTQSLDNNLLSGIDLLFHCAGEIKDPARMHALHVSGTNKLIDLFLLEAKKRSHPIRWVQLSSVGAYGPPSYPDEARCISEQTDTNPSGPYEETKTLSDELIESNLNQNCEYVILRPSNVIGPDMPNNSLRSLIRMVNKGFFFYIGKPGAIATYIHVNDVVKALLECGFKPEAKNQIFNLSNDCDLEELIDSIALNLNVKKPNLRFPKWFIKIVSNTLGRLPYFPLTNNRTNALISRTTYSTKKINEVLNFKPEKKIPDCMFEFTSK